MKTNQKEHKKVDVPGEINEAKAFRGRRYAEKIVLEDGCIVVKTEKVSGHNKNKVLVCYFGDKNLSKIKKSLHGDSAKTEWNDLSKKFSVEDVTPSDFAKACNTIKDKFSPSIKQLIQKKIELTEKNFKN